MNKLSFTALMILLTTNCYATENSIIENLAIPSILLLTVLIVVYVAFKAKIKITSDSIEVESTQTSKVEIDGVSNSEVEVVSHESRNSSVKDIRESSKVKIT